MTVIVWHAASRTMASDSRVVVGSRIGQTDKIWRIKGALFGGAGDAASTELVRDWLMRGGVFGKDQPKLADDAEFEAIFVSQEGAAFYLEARLVPIRIHGNWAIGSGSDFALAFMHTGMSATEAISKTADLADGVGGEIKSLVLGRK